MRTAIVRDWGSDVDYRTCWAAMQSFCAARTAETPDEIWVLQHAPVYTRGRNAQALAPHGPIPVIDSDRGGDITYHGPGQLVVYPLLDLGRLGIGVRHLVSGLETAVLGTLTGFGVSGGHTRPRAPGVYVADAKIASLGLRIRRGHSYHGLALNVAMDLQPFAVIAPCGYQGLRMTQLVDCGGPADMGLVARAVLHEFLSYLDLTPIGHSHDPSIGFKPALAAHP